jgi:hypothetical protein
MDESDRPNLGPCAFEQIDLELHEIDVRFGHDLRQMQESRLRPVIGLLESLPSPPRPEELKSILRWYAETLFYAEASKYPPSSPELGVGSSAFGNATAQH